MLPRAIESGQASAVARALDNHFRIILISRLRKYDGDVSVAWW
jgi:hypothetical protein